MGNASAGKAVVCNRSTPCTLTTKLGRAAGVYTIGVRYFDLRTGAPIRSALEQPASHTGSRMIRCLPQRSTRTSTAAPVRALRFRMFTSSPATLLRCAERQTRENRRRSITSKFNNNRAALHFHFLLHARLRELQIPQLRS